MSIALQLQESMAEHQAAVLGIVNPVIEQVATLTTELSEALSKAQDYDGVVQTLQEVSQQRDELQLTNTTLTTQLADAQGDLRWYKETLSTTRTELAAARHTISTLEQQLSQSGNPGTITEPSTPTDAKRAAFKIDPGFVPATHLSGDDLTLYKQAWAEVDDEWETFIEPLTRGCVPGRKGSTTPLPEGGMHLRNMRTVGHVNTMLLVLIHQLGDPAALKRLQELWRIVLNPKIMADRWGPLNKAATTRTVNGKVIDIEQIGVPRFNFMEPDGTFQNDLHELDQDLSTATVAEAAYVLKVNGLPEDFKVVFAYAEALITRIKRLAEAFQPGQPWYVQGKSLRHPSTARRTFHYFMWRITGDEGQKVAYEWYAKHLAADDDYLQLPVGEGVFFPHYTVSLCKARGDSNFEPGLQDITYLREDVPHEVFSLWAGAPFMSERFVAARARVVLSVALFGGAAGDKISASTGGYGNLDKRGQNGVSVNGVWTPGRWKNGRLGDTEPTFQITRSSPTLGAVYATDHPEYLQTLKDFDKRPDSISHRRYGGRISRLLYIARR